MFLMKLHKKFFNWNRISFLTVSFYLSFLQVGQFRSMNVSTFSEKILNPIPFQDSPLYLFQLKRFLEGNYSFGDGAIFEKANSGYSAGSSFIFSLWGTLGNLLDLNLLNTYTLMVFFSSALLFLATYLFLLDLGLEKLKAQLLSILIYSLVFGFQLGRPSPTQQTLWLVILAFSRVSRSARIFSFRNAILVNALLLVLLVCNPVYGLPVFAFYFLVIIGDSKNRLQKLITILPATFAFIVFKILNLTDTTPEQADQISRFGVFHSRLPGAFNSSIQLLLMGIFLRFLSHRTLDKRKNLLSNLNFSILIALNSQVITNTNFEMQSHLGFLAKFSILVSIIYLIFDIFKVQALSLSINSKNIFWAVSEVSLLLMVTILAIPATEVQKETEKISDLTKLINRLDREEYSSKVFVVTNSVIDLDKISYLALNTDIKLYWYPEAVFSTISDRELFERFACTLKEPLVTEEIERYDNYLFAHKYVNREQFYSKWNSLLAKIGLKTTWHADKYAGYERAQALIAKFQNNCIIGRYTKKADFIIEDNLIIRDATFNKVVIAS